LQKYRYFISPGQKHSIPQFNTLATGAEIQPLAGLPQETQAIINPSYATFTLSEQFREILPQFPPLMAPFANYTLDGSLTPLLFKKSKM
jgi:hypothetical protein